MRRSIPPVLLPVFAALTLLLVAPREAHAQRELLSRMGSKGQLAIDQLSGFRASSIGGVSYAGPIGFSIQNFSETVPSLIPNGPTSSNTYHFTSFWLAPSADYFVVDHLSIGGLVEIVTTSGSVDVPGNNNSTTNIPLQSTTSLTFLPRIGWMFNLTDRFSIWPRGGIGYVSRSGAPLPQLPAPGATDTFSSILIDLDVGFLYRINENWFLRGAPELSVAPGSHSYGAGNTSVSASASLFQFGVTGGIGVIWDL
jgi:hypothetical protein